MSITESEAVDTVKCAHKFYEGNDHFHTSTGNGTSCSVFSPSLEMAGIAFFNAEWY